MKIESEETLDLFRTAGPCELCGKPCRVREGHHLWARGQSSSKRLDVPINLIALGSTQAFQCECHTRIGMGNIEHERVLGVVAERENTLPETITAVIWLLQRLPKDPTPAECEIQMRDLNGPARELADKILGDVVFRCD